MSSSETNAAGIRQYNKKQGEKLVCDQQLAGEVPKTNEGTEHGLYCSEHGCEKLTMLWLSKLHPKKFQRLGFICGCCSVKKICLSEMSN